MPWLNNINGTRRLNELALPGTHDSAAWTHHSYLPSSTPGTWAQRKDITEQLELGVRVLDLRVGYASNNLTFGASSFVGMFHGPIYLNATLQDVFNSINTWIQANPTEFVILIFQQQGKPLQRDVSGAVNTMFRQTFQVNNRYHFNANAPLWPTVNDLRGRVMALGRLRAHVNGFCDVRSWLTDGDNTNGRIIDATGQLRIFLQDRYKGLSSATGYQSRHNDNALKFAIVEDAAIRLTHPSRTLIINHMSYSNLRYQPWQSGEGMNNLLLARNPALVIEGIMMIDDANQATVSHIINNN